MICQRRSDCTVIGSGSSCRHTGDDFVRVITKPRSTIVTASRLTGCGAVLSGRRRLGLRPENSSSGACLTKPRRLGDAGRLAMIRVS